MAVRLDSIVDKPVRLDSIEQPVRLDSVETEPDVSKPTGNLIPGTLPLPEGGMGTIGAHEPSAFERLRYSKTAKAVAGHYGFLLDPSAQIKRGEDPIIMGLGKVAQVAASYGVGRALYTPELLFGPDLAERIHRGITEYELKPKEKTVGEVTEFIGALKSAGQLMKPLIGLMPAREATKLITGGGATFMLRNLSEQVVDRIKKGKPVSGTELLVETVIGSAFGAIQAGGRHLSRYYRWFKDVSGTTGERVPRRLWFRTDEALRAAAEGMPKAKWDKLYKTDVEQWAKSYADAVNTSTTWTTKGYKGAADTTGIVRRAGAGQAGRRAAAPVVKRLSTIAAKPNIQNVIIHKYSQLLPKKLPSGKPHPGITLTENLGGLEGRTDIRGGAIEIADFSSHTERFERAVAHEVAHEVLPHITNKYSSAVSISTDIITGARSVSINESATPKLVTAAKMVKSLHSKPVTSYMRDVRAASTGWEDVNFGHEAIADAWAIKQIGGRLEATARRVNPEGMALADTLFADELTVHTKPEPNLFQPTQLAKRTATPGVIQPERRVLVPQSTALATAKKWERTKRTVGPSGKVITPQPTAIEKSAFRKWVNDYSSARALDLGVPVVPSDPDMRASRLETLNSLAKAQKRHEAKRAAAIDKSTGKPNYLNPWVSSRFMFMDFEEKTGVPVTHLVENIFSKSGKAGLEGYDLISNSIRLHELSGLTPQDNEHIAKYLFSPDTRKSIENDISPEALTVASRLEDILQGEAAKDVQEMVFRLWDSTGKKPPDVKQYGNPETILKHGRAAKAEGRLKEWIAEQPQWGVRRFYYMTDPMKQDMIDSYMSMMSRSALHAPGTAGEGLPGSFAYEAHARKGKPPIKEGSVVTNILTHVQRVKIANAIADDLNLLYGRLGSVELTERDKRVVKQIMDNVMMRRQPVDAPFEIMAQFRRMYWRPTMSYLWRPHTALWRSLRNSLQNYAFGPFAINVKEAGRITADVAAKRLQGVRLDEYDPEMMKRHEAVFHSYVSQRQAYYREFLLQDTANITRDFSRKGTARKAVAMMEKTGGLYGAVDEYVNRFPIWVTQYQITKQAANDYVNGKINKNQFFRRTNLESVQKPQQMLVQDLLSEGRVDDLAEASANWITEDVNFKYKTPERAGVEQTMAERSLMGIYTFPRGQVELIYRRGVKTLLQGIENKNVNQAYAGAANLVKGMMSSSATSALLYGYVGKRSYETYNALAYTMLDPGTGTVYSLLNWNWEQMMRYSQGEQSLMTTIDNVAEAWAKVGETLLVPLSVEIENWYEANNDKAGVTLYRLIRNGVAKKLGIEEKEFNKVTRTHKQALLHKMIGSYEFVPTKPKAEGRGARGTRGSR